MNVAPATRSSPISGSPIAAPLPVTRLKTPGGTPASRSARASRRALHGVALAGFSTTLLPVTSAAPAGPPASASGKLNGAITSHGPHGFMTLALTLANPATGSRAMART